MTPDTAPNDGQDRIPTTAAQRFVFRGLCTGTASGAGEGHGCSTRVVVSTDAPTLQVNTLILTCPCCCDQIAARLEVTDG